MLLYQVGGARDRHDFFDRLPARRKVDAVVVVGFQVEDAERAQLETMGVHIVAAGGQSAAYPSVHIDDHEASRQAVDHLLHLGHTRIGMLEALDPDQPRLESTRSPAYYEALERAGIAVDPSLVVTADWGGENGAESMSRLLGHAEPPTAVFAHSDEVALGAIRTLRRAGLRPGHDVSVVGIDDHPLAALTDLTTVRQRPGEQGVLAGRLLLDLLAGGTRRALRPSRPPSSSCAAARHRHTGHRAVPAAAEPRSAVGCEVPPSVHAPRQRSSSMTSIE